MESEHRGHGLHRKRLPVKSPTIKPVFGGVVLDDGRLDRLIRGRRRNIPLAKLRIIPVKRLRLQPLRFAIFAVVLNYDAHAMTAVVIGEIAHDPDAGMPHLDNRRDALGSS